MHLIEMDGHYRNVDTIIDATEELHGSTLVLQIGNYEYVYDSLVSAVDLVDALTTAQANGWNRLYNINNGNRPIILTLAKVIR